jgi:DNA polymerase III psi subunit
LGRNLTFKARKLLEWLNVPREEIERINLESLKHKNIQGIIKSKVPSKESVFSGAGQQQITKTIFDQWLVDADTEEEARAKVWQWLSEPHEGRSLSHDVYGAERASELSVEQEEGYTYDV